MRPRIYTMPVLRGVSVRCSLDRLVVYHACRNCRHTRYHCPGPPVRVSVYPRHVIEYSDRRSWTTIATILQLRVI